MPAELVERWELDADRYALYGKGRSRSHAQCRQIAKVLSDCAADLRAALTVAAATAHSGEQPEPLCRCGHTMSNHSGNGCNGVGGTGDPCFCSPLVACPKCGHALDSPDGCSECPPVPVSDEAEAWEAHIANEPWWYEKRYPEIKEGFVAGFRAARLAGKDEQP